MTCVLAVVDQAAEDGHGNAKADAEGHPLLPAATQLTKMSPRSPGSRV